MIIYTLNKSAGNINTQCTAFLTKKAVGGCLHLDWDYGSGHQCSIIHVDFYVFA